MDYTFQILNLESKPETLNQVGTLATQRMDYTFGSEFEKDLKAAVAKIVKPNQRFATPGYIFRAACYISTYAGLTYWYVTKGSSVPLCIAIGMSQASIGLNVQHDANHGAVSPNPFWNELLNYGNADHDDCPDSMVLGIRSVIGAGQLQTSWDEWGGDDRWAPQEAPGGWGPYPELSRTGRCLSTPSGSRC